MIEFILLILTIVAFVIGVLNFHMHVSFFRGKTSWFEQLLTKKVREQDN